MVVLNENIHEFDYLEKKSIKEIIKEWLFQEKYDAKIDRLEKELDKTYVNCRRWKTRCKNLMKENKELKERLKKYEK